MRAQRKCDIVAIDKINPFNRLTAISGYNVIPQAPTGRQAAEPTEATGGIAPVQRNTVGLNKATGISYAPAQCGKGPAILGANFNSYC